MHRDDDRASKSGGDPDRMGGSQLDRSSDETPASHGDPSLSGALGSDTGKVEVTGSEEDGAAGVVGTEGSADSSA